MPIEYGNSTLNNDKPAATAVNQSPSLTTKFSTPEGSGVRESSNSSRGIECPCKGKGHTCPIRAICMPIKGCPEFQRHIDEHYTRHYCDNCKKSFSRKETLEKHREKCSRSDDSSVRDDSSPKPQKRNFACGRCASYYHSSRKLAKHIHDYFKSPGQIPPWDSNNVIRGLLSSMNRQWSGPFSQSYYTWNTTSEQVQQLQENLEFGLKPPEVLVEAAIALSDYDASQHGHIESQCLFVPTSPNLISGQPIQTFNTSSLLGPLPGSDSTSFAQQTSYPSICALDQQANYPPQPYPQPERGHGIENQYPRNMFGIQPASNFWQQSEGQVGASYPTSYNGYLQSASPYAANNLPASMTGGLNDPNPSFTYSYQPFQASTLASSSSFAPHPDAYDNPNADVQPPYQEMTEPVIPLN